jgi:hypothetical protein
MEIGAKLNKSRMDMSICKSDKGVGNSFFEESMIIGGFEVEGNEEDISHSLSEL